MEYKNLTKTQKIPVLGLGTWHMGGDMTPDYSDDDKYVQAIKYAISKGITHIDTAEIYSGGHAEELVGRAIKKVDRKALFIRSEKTPAFKPEMKRIVERRKRTTVFRPWGSIRRKTLFITSKVWPTHLSFEGIIKACQWSLERLQTNYLDLYLIHWPNPLASMKNAMAAFDQLVKERKVKHIGVSNFSAKQLQNAQKYTKNKIVTNQVHYSLLHRDPEKGLLEYCQKENIILTAYTPIEKGRVIEEYKALQKVAIKYHKTQIQVALRWLIEKPNVIVIPKASTKDHIDEILGSLSWKMKEEDQEYLSQEF